MAQRRHEIAVRRLMVDQEREGLRLVAPGLHPVEAVLRDEVGRIALGDAAPLRRDDVGVIIFALVVEYLPVVEADALGRMVDVPFAEHRGRIARLAQRARPDPYLVVEPLAVLGKAMRVALASGQQRRAAGPAQRIADEALRAARAILFDAVDVGRGPELRTRRALGRTSQK